MNGEIKDKILVAVYGSLRKNYWNHRLLEDSKFLGEFRTGEIFTMFSLGAYPGINLNGKHSITCEIYEVNNRTFERLDQLEGYPHYYNRVQIETPYGHAWIYYLERESNNYNIVESGDWNEYTNKNGKN